MLSQDDSRSLYITGGQGGPGGQGYLHGTGGPGGAGLGPNVHITAQQLIAHNLHATLASEQAFKLSNVRASQILNHCPPPSRIFHGRRNILDKMHDFFSSNMGSQHIYVLYGLGGAGKTQIGLKFINESSSCFSDIFFIDTSTIVTIETGLKNIAVAKDFGDSPQDGLLWLTSKVEEWLLFFDNADDPSINLNDFIPQCTHGNIIITSRNPGLRVYARSHSLVSDMEEEDAVALLLKSAAQEVTFSTQKNATEIIKALHYLPLAIVQAGAFISKSQDLHGYLALYTKNQAQLLSEKPAQPHDRYAWTVYTTWQISFAQLTPPAAMVLQHCSFLYHNGISEEIFSNASRYTFRAAGPSELELQGALEFLSHFLRPTGEWDSLQFLHATNEIQAYSLMSFDSEKKLFSIHPLVHAWSQAIVCNPERYMSTIGSILGMAISERPNRNIQLASVVLCPHVEFVVQMNAKVALDFSVKYGLMFSGAGKYKQAEKLLKEVLEKRKQLLGDNHLDTLLAMGNLASTYSDLGEHQKAEELEIIVLEKQKQLLGDNHPATLLAMGNLASTYSDRGEYQKAKELEVIVVQKQKQLLGDNHPATLLAMGNLARTYSDLGEHQTAEELEIIVLEKQKQLLGDNHPDTLLAMGNLAKTYSDLGEHQKAEELKVIVLEKRKQLLGDNHPATLLAMGNLARTYSDLGEYQKAEELKVIVLQKQKQLLGDNHPATLLAMGNLARTYSDLGKYQKAEELEIIVLEKRKQLLGDNHPATLLAMGNLARTYSDLGEHQKAEELKVIVLQKQKQLLGDNHPATLLAMGNLARTYSDLGEYQKAEELEIIVLEKQKQLLGDNHPATLLAMGNLASTYSDLGKYQKAEELKVIVLQKQKQLLGDNHQPPCLAR
ncbi:FabD/lysophospholipase-like protein [Mycena venus]|uniref:FabD/lysophospholipase-like protein n=1 Tax=Mycena venus TaxID=2733690 RepID=A0A8H7DEQ9_9AGAR|nr:FabD/lysophospholipase-like protein [Mycena venus]